MDYFNVLKSALFLRSAVFIVLYMTFTFIVSRIKGKISVIDCFWGVGFVALGLYLLFSQGHFCSRQLLLITLVCLWGVRLSWHITARSSGKPDDRRYLVLTSLWQKYRSLQIYLKVYLVQGIFMLLVALPIIITLSYCSGSLLFLDYCGLGLWIVGFFFEVVGDYQLDVFLKNPDNKGKIMRYGLWRYTRHPNYFGEVAMWWGIFLIALSGPHGLLAILSPLTISYLLLYVSGIPMLEKNFENNPEFQEYKKKTSSFFPWFEKK